MVIAILTKVYGEETQKAVNISGAPICALSNHPRINGLTDCFSLKKSEISPFTNYLRLNKLKIHDSYQYWRMDEFSEWLGGTTLFSQCMKPAHIGKSRLSKKIRIKHLLMSNHGLFQVTNMLFWT